MKSQSSQLQTKQENAIESALKDPESLPPGYPAYSKVLAAVYLPAEEKPPVKKKSNTSKYLTLKIKEKRWHSVTEEVDGFFGKDEHELIKEYLEEFNAGNFIIQQQIDLISNQLEQTKAKEEKDRLHLSSSQKELLEIQKEKLEEKLKSHEKTSKENEEKLATITDPEVKHKKRKFETEQCFFNPKRLKSAPAKETEAIAQEQLKNRLVDGDEKVTTITIEKVPARRLISAERSLQQAAVNRFGYSKEEHDTTLGYFSNPKNVKTKKLQSVPDRTYFTEYSNTEKMKMGETISESKHRIYPGFNRMGNCLVTSLGNYESILATINEVCDKDEDDEIALAKLMLRFGRKGELITFQEVLKIEYDVKKVNEIKGRTKKERKKIRKEIAEHVDKLNQICNLVFIKEPAQWCLSKDKEFHLPLATAQARAFILLSQGCLCMAQVIGKDAPYGVFTGSGLTTEPGRKNMSKKIKTIDAKYLEFLKENKLKDSQQFNSFFKEHPNAEFIPTRKQIRADLQEVYGARVIPMTRVMKQMAMKSLFRNP